MPLNDTANAAPYGYCQCGCGQKTWIATQTRQKYGWRKGDPVPFVKNHNKFLPPQTTRELNNDSVAIDIGRGYEAIIDADDISTALSIRWHPSVRKRTVYAVSNSGVLLHRLLMDAPDDLLVDHINGVGLDNRRRNLRLCTAPENARNSAPQVNTRSRFKGVSLHRQSGKWRSEIKINDKRTHLGVFAFEEDAARAYDAAARELHGEFARLNFPGDFGTKSPALPNTSTPALKEVS